MKKYLFRCYWLLNAQFGIDPIKFIRSFRGLPRFLRDLLRFRTGYSGNLELLPCLHDWYEEAGSTRDEYFWQDLIVARLIFTAKPEKHVDIGSRIDGFVAHIASFREIEIFDIRPITSHIPGVIFKQADLMGHDIPMGDYCDSLSCLHALEHFGLGRYGDPVDPKGYESGLRNMSRILRKGGYFYLSVPIGMERVVFNANWVFDPSSIVRCAEAAGLTLQKLIVITPSTGPQESVINDVALAELALKPYQLGLFIFKKLQSTNAQ